MSFENTPSWTSRDGRILSTVAHDRLVQWDVTTHRRLRAVPLPGLSEGFVDGSEDGRYVAYHDADALVVAGLADGSRRRLPIGSWRDTDAAFTPDGRALLVRRLAHGAADERADLEIWDVRGERMLFRHQHGTGDGPLPVQSPDGRYLAWCTDHGGLPRLFDTVRRRPVATPVPAATGRTLCQGDDLTFTADSGAVATAGADGVVTWDLRTGRERPRLPLAGGGYRVAFAGDYALTLSPGTLALWRPDLPDPPDDGPREPLLTFPVASTATGDLRLDLAAGVLRYEVQGRTASVHTVSLQGLTGPAWRERALGQTAFDSRGRSAPARKPLVVAGAETVTADPSGRTALTPEGPLVDIGTGRKRAGVTGEDYLAQAAFSPDGRYLAAADLQGRVTLWDARSWRRLGVLTHGGGSNRHEAALAFSADGSLVAVGDADGSVRVWETAAPALPGATLPAGDAPTLALGITPGGGEVRLATPHLPYRALPLAPSRAAATVCARAAGGLPEAEWRGYFPSAEYRGSCGT
ncbi:hypothetical protein ABZ896_39295 [Streptomyces sp. NPDC047072]|uniref:WD40 repeat domain-containing protein n=1 Tax=Streptomyces sp. NPDC047072 TaxID=3154809 RepID=UPI0033F59068